MKIKLIFLNALFACLILLNSCSNQLPKSIALPSTTVAAAPVQKTIAKDYYELRIYHTKTPKQIVVLDDHFKNAFLPALHRAGLKNIGVFKPIEKDTANFGKKIYVLITHPSLESFLGIEQILDKDTAYQNRGSLYINAPEDLIPYERVEKILMSAFKERPKLKTPVLNTLYPERIYELRSYESATEKQYANKVHMFNEGKEVDIFDKLKMGPVFYAEVLAGARTPNLMYMTSFDNMVTRNLAWKTFGVDPDWVKLKEMALYKSKNVSKADILFLTPADYSDY